MFDMLRPLRTASVSMRFNVAEGREIVVRSVDMLIIVQHSAEQVKEVEMSKNKIERHIETQADLTDEEPGSALPTLPARRERRTKAEIAADNDPLLHYANNRAMLEDELSRIEVRRKAIRAALGLHE